MKAALHTVVYDSNMYNFAIPLQFGKLDKIVYLMMSILTCFVL